MLVAEIDPTPNEPAPFRLDLSKVRARTQDSGAETAGDEVLAGDLDAAVLAGEAGSEIPSLRFSPDDGSSGFSLPSFGIWFGWLFLVVGSFVVIVTFDERQRRRD